MGAEAGNEDGAAIVVKAGIIDKGELRGEVKAADDVGSVVSLAYTLAPISQRAIT